MTTEVSLTCCYSQLLAFMFHTGEQLEQAVSGVEFDTPNFTHEGMAGFIETKVRFSVRNLVLFARLWEEAYQYPSSKPDFYKTLRGKCK